MQLPILQPNDPRLSQPTAPIPIDAITSADTQRDLNRLFSLARPERADHSQPLLVGLAAPQVGIAKRIILIDIAADGHGGIGELRAFINPTITEQSDAQQTWYEGCYSTRPVCGIVTRPQRITLEAYTPSGRRVRQSLEGYVARIFQHELDHLDGRLFIERITNDADLHWVEDHEFPLYRDQEGWRTWPKPYPRERWHQMRSRPH